MQPFVRHRGIVAVIFRANIDTDQIIPKQFLKSVKRTGYGENLFYDWRYDREGKPRPDFLLNRDPFRRATILVAGNNFGCGSSREHAVWALLQFGFRVVVAPWKEEGGAKIPAFADIFRGNAVRNGLLTVELGPGEVEEIVREAESQVPLEATVDLEQQQVILHSTPERIYRFDIAENEKRVLLEGLDPIALTLRDLPEIERFEKQHDVQLYGSGGGSS